MEIRKVGVLGCGLMGSGIAQTAASAGFDSKLFCCHAQEQHTDGSLPKSKMVCVLISFSQLRCY